MYKARENKRDTRACQAQVIVFKAFLGGPLIGKLPKFSPHDGKPRLLALTWDANLHLTAPTKFCFLSREKCYRKGLQHTSHMQITNAQLKPILS